MDEMIPLVALRLLIRDVGAGRQRPFCRSGVAPTNDCDFGCLAEDGCGSMPCRENVERAYLNEARLLLEPPFITADYHTHARDTFGDAPITAHSEELTDAKPEHPTA